MSKVRSSRRRGPSHRRLTVRAVDPSQGLKWIYWLLPLLLTGVQWLVSTASMHQIRYEELAESVRNVFWLDHRLVYDGISSNVGWYGTLLAVYRIFGFSLFTAKFVRLGLHLIGLYSVAYLLRHGMSARTAIVPLVAVGLSPTLLYLDTLQTSFGLDLAFAALCLALLFSVRTQSPAGTDLWKMFLCGLLATIGATSYPTLVLYVPSFLVIAVWFFRREAASGSRLPGRWKAWYALSASAGIVLPLVAVLLFLRTPSRLLADPATHAGLFRGGGGAITFDPGGLTRSLGTVLGDLFVKGQSYYFELTRPDFSGLLAIAGLCGIGATTIYLSVTRKTDRTILLATGLLLATNAIVPNLSTGGSPGIRRCTGILAAYFVLFAVVWRFYATTPLSSVWLRRTGLLLCLLLPLDSALKLPSLMSDVKGDSLYRNADWFAIEATPTDSLDYLLAQFAKGQALACPIDQDRRVLPCRYQEIYSAMAGYRAWNGLGNAEIHALDWRTGRDITLTPALWTDYYFPH